MSRWNEIISALIGDIEEQEPNSLRAIAIELQTRLDGKLTPDCKTKPKTNDKPPFLLWNVEFRSPKKAYEFLGITKSNFYYHLRKSRAGGYDDLGSYLEDKDVLTNRPIDDDEDHDGVVFEDL